LQPVRAPDDPGERDAGTHPRARAQARGGGRAGADPAAAGGRRAPGGQVPRAAVRRPAAARRDRPVAGDAAQAHALRRAHVRAGSGDDQRGPRHDGRARGGGDDDGRRHPRDGLRPQGRAPRRVHGRRRDRRGREAGGVLHESADGPRPGLPVETAHQLTPHRVDGADHSGAPANPGVGQGETMKKLSTIIAGSAITLLALTACGQEGTPEAEGEGGTQAEAPEYTVAEDVDLSDSETWEAANSAGTLTVGVKMDQPGLGNTEPGSDAPEGFDIEIAKITAAALGFAPDQIEWVE